MPLSVDAIRTTTPFDLISVMTSSLLIGNERVNRVSQLNHAKVELDVKSRLSLLNL